MGLFVVWTVFALATYAAVGTGTGWLVGSPNREWLDPILDLVAAADGPVVGVLRLAGTIVIVASTFLLYRLVVRVR